MTAFDVMHINVDSDEREEIADAYESAEITHYLVKGFSREVLQIGGASAYVLDSLSPEQTQQAIEDLGETKIILYSDDPNLEDVAKANGDLPYVSKSDGLGYLIDELNTMLLDH